MTEFKLYDVSHLQTIRVDLRFDMHGYHVLIVPDPKGGPFFRDFYMVQNYTGRTIHMFGVPVQEDDLAIELAAFADPKYKAMLEEVEK